MEFTAKIYRFERPDTTINDKIVYFSWLIGFLAIIPYYFGIIVNGFAIFLLILSLIVTAFMRAYSMVNIEEHNKESLGIVKFSTECLLWNKTRIEWNEIEEITVDYYDFEGKYINYGYNNYNNSQSSGLDNKLKVLTKNNKEFKGNMFLKFKSNSATLRDLLWKIIEENNISLSNAKRMINPINYKEHQDLKKIITV